MRNKFVRMILLFFEILFAFTVGNDIHRGQITTEKQPKLSGFRVEPQNKHHGGFYGYTENGLSIVEPEAEMLVVIMGYWLDMIDLVGFTINNNCSQTVFDVERAEHLVRTEKRLIFKYSFNEENIFKVCYKQHSRTDEEGNSINYPYLLVTEPEFYVTTILPSKSYYFPLPVQVGVLAICLILSGIFSGLNLGLMSLSPQELELISKSGTEKERIVILGEIVPQSVCVKKGLQVGAYTVWITKFFMALTSPASYPISKILDCLLGEEVVSYDRKRLIELIKMSTLNETDLAEELKIAVGAMEISDKTVGDVMTKINDVFMLPATTVLNPKTINEILRMGYTRIPIYFGDRNHVISLLFVKDLALIDPDDNFTVKTVCDYHKHKLRFVMADMSLRALLEEFKKGEYHLAMVQKKYPSTEKLELVGLITLEDIVEEILQAEIVDESDFIVDNESKYLPSLFENDSGALLISTQMQMVTVQWLRTNHIAFHSDLINQSVLEKLVRQHVRRIEVTTEELDPHDVAYNPATKLYTKKQLSNKFILILEGRVNVTIGESAMTFEAGPWYCFGTEILDTVLKLIRKHKENQENEKFQDIAFIDTTRSVRDSSPLKKNIRDVSLSGREVSLTRRDLSGTRRDGSLTKLGDYSTRHSLESEVRRISFVPDYTAVITDDCTFLEITATSYVLAYKTSLITAEKH